jgi:hypothetical protein
MPPFLDGIAMCQVRGDYSHAKKGASVEKVTIIGIDLAKNVFQLHGATSDGTVVFRKNLSRPLFHRFMSEHPGCVVAMEACGGAHYWAREMDRLGHEVRLIAPRYVEPFIKRQKNDAADAEAIVEAALRPTMRFVEPKSAEQQARARRRRSRRLGPAGQRPWRSGLVQPCRLPLCRRRNRARTRPTTGGWWFRPHPAARLPFAPVREPARRRRTCGRRLRSWALRLLQRHRSRRAGRAQGVSGPARARDLLSERANLADVTPPSRVHPAATLAYFPHRRSQYLEAGAIHAILSGLVSILKRDG